MSSIILPVVSSAGVRVLRTLIGRPPKTVADLISELQVTRTAIIAQLNELISMGFIEQRLEYSNTPGRPKFRYTATDKAVSCLYGGLQQKLVPSLMKRFKEAADAATFHTLCHEVAMDVVAPVLSQITAEKPVERMRQYVERWKENGRLIEFVEYEDYCEVTKYACPFVTMMDEAHTVCELDLIAMRLIAGEDNVERTEYRYDGHPCCIFRVRKTEKNS